jgi:hypothetical protein
MSKSVAAKEREVVKEMAGLLLEILGMLELDELPVNDRPALFLKIVQVLGKAGFNVMGGEDVSVRPQTFQHRRDQ